MLINLLEIPAEGKTFICNQNTADLNESLRDLIGKTPHQAEFTVRPLTAGNFELSGWIKTALPEDCSRCGLDFSFQVNEKFKELLMPSLNVPRNSKYTKANHVSDMTGEGPSVAEYRGHHFNAGEYLHQVVALAEPFNPAPACDVSGNCALCKKNVKDQSFNYEDPGFEEPQNPFGALKNIKLN